jgi:predicted nucleic-acid-binding protein
MKAVDTNILARFFIDDPDDPEAARQRAPATRAMSAPIFVPITVILELEWVMRGFYSFAPAEVRRVLLALCGLATATVEDRNAVLQALDLHGRGFDFADALHLARSQSCEALVTFDRGLARRANAKGSAVRVELAK